MGVHGLQLVARALLLGQVVHSLHRHATVDRLIEPEVWVGAVVGELPRVSTVSPVHSLFRSLAFLSKLVDAINVAALALLEGLLARASIRGVEDALEGFKLLVSTAVAVRPRVSYLESASEVVSHDFGLLPFGTTHVQVSLENPQVEVANGVV